MSLLDQFPHRCTISRKDRTNDVLGGGRATPTVLQTDVQCWEQQESSSEVRDFGRQGISTNRKIYFFDDPNLNEQHTITITHRMVNGVLTAVAAADQVPLDVVSETLPDAFAGLGILFKVRVQATDDKEST